MPLRREHAANDLTVATKVSATMMGEPVVPPSISCIAGPCAWASVAAATCPPAPVAKGLSSIDMATGAYEQRSCIRRKTGPAAASKHHKRKFTHLGPAAADVNTGALAAVASWRVPAPDHEDLTSKTPAPQPASKPGERQHTPTESYRRRTKNSPSSSPLKGLQCRSQFTAEPAQPAAHPKMRPVPWTDLACIGAASPPPAAKRQR